MHIFSYSTLDLENCMSLFQSLKDARRCAFLGELDSVEDSDEISDEFEFSDEWSDEAYEFDRADYSTAARRKLHSFSFFLSSFLVPLSQDDPN